MEQDSVMLIRYCESECEVHNGKVEFHHPITGKPLVGLNLCELHHSLIYGRKKRHPIEMAINKTIEEMRAEVKAFEAKRIIEQGCNPSEIDKH